jgi:cobalt transporter subunit CbtA
VFNRILATAGIAGIAVALALTAAQAQWVTPLILKAELLEEARAASHQPQTAHDRAGDAGHHKDDAWQPGNGWQRTLATAAGNGLMCIGFAMVLCGVYALRPPVRAWHGLAWGVAGYLAFYAAPSLGLPPELPGTAGAGLYARQAWWLATAAATAAGLSLLLLQPRHLLRAAGVLLLVLPHLIGAPRPAVEESLAPAEMQAQFQTAAFIVNGMLWLLLGTLTAAVFMRLARREPAA